MKIQHVNMQIARALKNADTAKTVRDKNKWTFHAEELKKLLGNLGAKPGRPRRITIKPLEVKRNG